MGWSIEIGGHSWFPWGPYLAKVPQGSTALGAPFCFYSSLCLICVSHSLVAICLKSFLLEWSNRRTSYSPLLFWAPSTVSTVNWCSLFIEWTNKLHFLVRVYKAAFFYTYFTWDSECFRNHFFLVIKVFKNDLPS